MDESKLGELLERAANGDREAAGELARAYEGRVRSAIHHRLGPEIRARLDTDDLFQSTIAAAIKDVKGLDFQGEKAFVAWLRTVAERRIRMAVRHHRAEKRDLRKDRPVDAAGDLRARHTTPTQAAVRGELTAGVREAMTQLDEEERTIVQLHTFDGLSFQEVADRLELANKGAAHTIFRRALKKMADHL